MPTRLTTRLSGSFSKRRGAKSMGYGGCRSVQNVGRGLMFRRFGWMGGVRGVL